jgi:hypothetical protein
MAVNYALPTQTGQLGHRERGLPNRTLEQRLRLRNEYASSKVFVAGSCMCIIAWLILGVIAGWFVASQGVNIGGASDFRTPPAHIFRAPYDNPRRSPCPRAKRYIPRSVTPDIPRSVTPEIVGPVQRQDRRPRDRTLSSPSINRRGIVRVTVGPAKPPLRG